MPSATSAHFAYFVRRWICSISAIRAMIPPSPPLSARMMKVRYLSETMIVIDQKTSEMTPKTSPSVGSTLLWSIEKTVCSAYSGLVPMSPKTTPSAPRVSAAMPAFFWAACLVPS